MEKMSDRPRVDGKQVDAIYIKIGGKENLVYTSPSSKAVYKMYRALLDLGLPVVCVGLELEQLLPLQVEKEDIDIITVPYRHETCVSG